MIEVVNINIPYFTSTRAAQNHSAPRSSITFQRSTLADCRLLRVPHKVSEPRSRCSKTQAQPLRHTLTPAQTYANIDASPRRQRTGRASIQDCAAHHLGGANGSHSRCSLHELVFHLLCTLLHLLRRRHKFESAHLHLEQASHSETWLHACERAHCDVTRWPKQQGQGAPPSCGRRGRACGRLGRPRTCPRALAPPRSLHATGVDRCARTQNTPAQRHNTSPLNCSAWHIRWTVAAEARRHGSRGCTPALRPLSMTASTSSM